MPRKFRRFVPKGYSRKTPKVRISALLKANNFLVDSVVQTHLHFNADEDMH